MAVQEQSPETRGAKPDPLYVQMADYIAKHIGDPALTIPFLMTKFQAAENSVYNCLHQLPSVKTRKGILGLSKDADMESLQEEVAMARQKPERRNYTKTPVERQTPSHVHGARSVHRRRA